MDQTVRLELRGEPIGVIARDKIMIVVGVIKQCLNVAERHMRSHKCPHVPGYLQ